MTDKLALAMNTKKIIAQALEDLFSQRAGLLLKAEELKGRAVLMHEMPLHPDECKAMILADIEDAAATYPARAGWPEIFGSYANPQGRRPLLAYPMDTSGDRLHKNSGPINLADLLYIQGPGSGSGGVRLNYLANDGNKHLLHGDGSAAGTKAESLAIARLAFFFGDAIKEKVGKYFDTAQQHRTVVYPSRATAADKLLTIEQRLAEIDKLNSQVEEIDAQLAAIDQQVVQMPGGGREKWAAHVRAGVPMEEGVPLN